MRFILFTFVGFLLITPSDQQQTNEKLDYIFDY